MPEIYNHKEIEAKWRERWDKDGLYKVDLDKAEKPFYNLMMFPYPSAEGLHVGNMYAFVHSDAYGRFMRLKGYDVFEPIGLDGFGIHSENYAIKIKEHIKNVSARTEKHFYEQLHQIGNAYDWSRTVETYKPDYYKWTQWLFLKMFERGLAYRKAASVNWCPSCKTVLSDEQVISGNCERCGTATEKRQMEQWFWRITDYAEKLLNNLETIDWSEEVKLIQKNWIGRSEGAEVVFKVPIKYPRVNLGFKTQVNHRVMWFLTFPTKRRKLFFETKDECLEIINALYKCSIKHDFVLHEISILQDHIHIIVDTDKKYSVEKIFKYLKGGSAKRFLEKYNLFCENSKGRHIWAEKGNYSIINNEEEYKKTLAYVKKNPGKDDLIKNERLLSENLNNLFCNLEVFTTRPDTLFGCTYMVVSPEHPLIANHESRITNREEVEKYIEIARKKTEVERTDVSKEKTGVKLEGLMAVNPVNNIEIPIYVADYVLAGYGTGAIMAVPAHDERDYEFAKKYGLPIVEVVKQTTDNRQQTTEIFCGEGVNANSGFLDGLPTGEAKKKINRWLEEKGLGQATINYKLRDWCVSRQRYWGPPIPMIQCEKCGWVSVPEEDLPVLLPEMDDFLPDGTGKGPLNKIDKFVNTTCPKCGGPAKRETDVSDPFVDSSWYFMRYLCTDFADRALDKDRLKKWMPVDTYIGGKEHAVLHLLYSRFVNMVMHELGLAPTEEPYQRFRAHGLLIRDGAKISKSKGNIVNPDEYIEKYGADAVRMYLMFLGDMRIGGGWRDSGMNGMYKFVKRISSLVDSEKMQNANLKMQNLGIKKLLHKTIKGVGADLENLKYNTAIAKLMTLVNGFEKDGFGREELEKFAILLAPFAPFLAEEIYADLGYRESIFKAKWPEYDPALVKDETINLVVQVNGKLRDTIEVDAGIEEEEAKKTALKSEKIQKWITGKEVVKVIFVKGKLVNVVIG